MRFVLFITLSFTTFASAAATQLASRPVAPDEPQVHRVQAGDVGPDGWCDAKSTGRGFAVSMPRKFNDMSVGHRQDDGTLVRTHVVAATFDNGTRFVASASSNASVKLAPHAASDYVDLLAAKGLTLRHRKPVKMDGVDATEIEVVHSRTVARHRVGQRDDVIYVMSIERPGEDFPKEAEQIATRFFDSFRLPAPQGDAAPPKASPTESATAPPKPSVKPFPAAAVP